MALSPRLLLSVLAFAACTLPLAACQAGAAVAPSVSATDFAAVPTESPQPREGDVVGGYRLGEIPPVPLFALPDLSLLADSLSGFTFEMTESVGDFPGLTVAPASCTEAGELKSGSGSVYLYGDGSGTFTNPDGTVMNYGDGAGSYSINGVDVFIYGDGSGSYDGDSVHIFNYGDGSGRYTTDDLDVFIYGDGSGSYEAGDVKIFNYGDGSASYDKGEVHIFNYGDGSASYEAPGLSIFNYGEGVANVNGRDVDAERVAPVPPMGKFPPMGVLAPIESCGTKITLDAGVLFDFDKSEVRPDAAGVLDSLARVLQSASPPEVQVGGHTDSIDSDEYNLKLSERRAAAVVAALKSRGVTTNIEATGYGESRPMAPNTTPDGDDNPAGRQLNRRVEIFIPAFG